MLENLFNYIDGIFLHLQTTQQFHQHQSTHFEQVEFIICMVVMIGQKIEDMAIVSYIYLMLEKLVQKNLPGHILYLILYGLSSILQTANAWIIFHTDLQQTKESILKLAKLILKIEEQLLFQCHDHLLIVMKSTNTTPNISYEQHPSFELLLFCKDQSLALYDGFSLLEPVFISFAMHQEMEEYVSLLIDRFLITIKEILPIINQEKVKNEEFFFPYLLEIISVPLISIISFIKRLMNYHQTDYLYCNQLMKNEESYGLITKYLRLWIGLTICQIKLHDKNYEKITIHPTFYSLLFELAAYTPPLYFGKLLGTSKTVDLVDELIANDPLLTMIINDCITHQDKLYLQTVIDHRVLLGLSTAAFYYFHTILLLESLRSKFSLDIRPLFSYLGEICQWQQKAKK
jgi:hypothetical protein